MNAVVTFVITFLCWIVFNGHLSLQIVLVGILLSVLLALFTSRFIPGEESHIKSALIKRFPLYVKYIFVLVWEIIKAALGVIKIILSPGKKISPVLCTFKTDLKETSSRVLLANSITLTPGTITVALEGDTFKVHCLDREMSNGLNESIFVKQLRLIEAIGK